ncbi:MAG: bacterial proteasome activator family protein [Actinomycetota bacterium]
MTDAQPETPEIVEPSQAAEEQEPSMTISEPAKVMRIGTMIRQLLEEVRATDLDEPGRDRLREIYETSVAELSEALSPDLQEELARLALPFDDDEVPSEAELRVAQAQLVGWLEGLFHGIQATLFAQQNAARQQLELMQRSQALPPGQQVPGQGPEQQSGGVYL